MAKSVLKSRVQKGGTNFSSLGWEKKGGGPKFSSNPRGEPKPYRLWLYLYLFGVSLLISGK